jgi:hypothetical protein
MAVLHDTAASPADRARIRRLAGWSGIGMVVAILINGPVSIAVGRMPNYWTADAADRLSRYLSDDANITKSIAFFALSNLIFVFALGFFSGLRRLGAEADTSGWVAGVVTIGAALFLAGGLVSEILSTGLAVVLRSTPGYTFEVNDALLLQGLWMTALAQAQVALGTLITVLCLATLRPRLLPAWLCWLGIVAGIVAILRPAIVTEVPIFIASFQPVLLWIASVSVVFVRQAGAMRHQ